LFFTKTYPVELLTSVQKNSVKLALVRKNIREKKKREREREGEREREILAIMIEILRVLINYSYGNNCLLGLPNSLKKSP